jgi:hypothetical protein
MTYTNIPYSVVDNKKIDFSTGKNSVKKLTENILYGKSLFNYSNQTLRVVPADVVRYVSQSLNLATSGIYRSSLINFVLSCERNCAGSGIVFLLLLSDNLIVDENRKLRLEKQELDEVVNFYLGKGSIAKNVLSLFYNCGYQYQVHYGESFLENIGLSIGTSSKVPGYIDPLFYDTKLDEDCTLICVDGVVETLGEIDPLLHWSTKNKKTAIIIATGFSPDVSNTLKTNWDSGKLFVVPFVVDIDGLATAKSISAGVVSTDTGVRLSNIDLDACDSTSVSKKAGDHLYVSCGLDGESVANVNFLFPTRLKSIHELMKERVKFGIALTKNCLLKGLSLVTYGDSKIKVPSICLDYALKAREEWKKIQNVSCVVTLEQKNSLSKH